jgi:hypothetical protein
VEAALQDSIAVELEALKGPLQQMLTPIAATCSPVWDSSEKLNGLMSAALRHIDQCKLLYALDCNGIQRSGNVAPERIERSKRGQDLSVRPYMKQMEAGKKFLLSGVYIDVLDKRPCITAMQQVVASDGKILGCIAADFDLRNLPSMQTGASYLPGQWRQIKGDPAIRQNLFSQERVASAMDEQQEMVNSIVTDIMQNRGIFHAKLHYSSSRATLWLYRDPHRYRLHVLDEITNPDVCLAYPLTPYPEEAMVPKDAIYQIFSRFNDLRNADHTVYLRSASLNVINNMVGLNFSCDGSHYMSVQEFMDKDDHFWFGAD